MIKRFLDIRTQGGSMLLAALLLSCCVPSSWGVTTLEGYSQVMIELRSSGGGDPSWQLSNPELLAELRLKTSPWRDIDTYLKLEVRSNRWVDDLKDTKMFLKEGHAHFRTTRFEAHLFAGQDRFWLNEPLLDVVHQDQVKHDDYGPRAQGIRLDFWDLYGVYGAAFLSERSDYFSRAYSDLTPSQQEYFPGVVEGDTIRSRTDDYRAIRLNRMFASDRILLGSTYGRKDFIRYSEGLYSGRLKDHDEVIALDAELALGELVPGFSRFGRVTWATEIGRNISGWLVDVDGPRANGFKTELRDVRVGPLKLIGSYEDYGTQFYTDGLAKGDKRDMNDYSAYYAEVRYRVPTKAINLKGWLRHAEPEHPGSTGFSETVGTQDEWGTEAYVEFLNGFAGTVNYKVYEDANGIWPNLFFQVTGENRLVKLRTQFRIKDIDTDYELTAYGFEVNVNLSEKWKFYSRVMNVDEKTESRQTAFAQLRYLGWTGSEFFIEFGNPDQSNDLVNDGDFVDHWSGATTDKVFKTFLRIYY